MNTINKFMKTYLVFNQNGFTMKEYIFGMNSYLPNRRPSNLICKIFFTV